MLLSLPGLNQQPRKLASVTVDTNGPCKFRNNGIAVSMARLQLPTISDNLFSCPASILTDLLLHHPSVRT